MSESSKVVANSIEEVEVVAWMEAGQGREALWWHYSRASFRYGKARVCFGADLAERCIR